MSFPRYSRYPTYTDSGVECLREVKQRKYSLPSTEAEFAHYLNS